MDRDSAGICADTEQPADRPARHPPTRQTRLRLPANAARDVEKFQQRSSGDIQVFSPEEVMGLVRAAGDEQDAAIYLTAAFTGLRMGELLALRWRDVDFEHSVLRVRASFSGGALTTPKSGEVRSVPLAPQVAEALAKLGQRQAAAGDDELVFRGELGETSTARRCDAGIASLSAGRGCGRCASTTCATRSGRA